MNIQLGFALILIYSKLSFELSFKESQNNVEVSRILGGRFAKNGEFPYTVYVETEEDGCGGLLITKSIVITAAHCVYNNDIKKPLTKDEVIVRVGDVSCVKGTIMKLSDVIVYPTYNPAESGDIAILKLRTEVQIGDNVQTVAIPDSSHKLKDRNPVIQVGWGEYGDDSGPSEILKTSDKGYLLLNASCRSEMSKWTPEGFICISNKCGDRACGGDSGSPLIIEEKNQKVVIGTLSHSYCIRCVNNTRSPTMFSDISFYAEWIKQKTNNDKAIRWIA